MDSDAEVRATAALLVARLAGAIQATKKLRALQNGPQLLALEELVLERFAKGNPMTFLNQKRLFSMIPPPLLEKICRECHKWLSHFDFRSWCFYSWRSLPLVSLLVNSNTRHLSLNLENDSPYYTLENEDVLFGDIAREGKTSLLSLEISGWSSPRDGLHLTRLSSLLRELRALTSLHITHLWESCAADVDHLVSVLASTNPHIRSLKFPDITNQGLTTIAESWPQLESFHLCIYHDCQFDSSQLAAVLSRLRNLQTLQMREVTLSEALLKVARAHDPASPPYKLAEGFSCHIKEPVSSGDFVKLFTAFPALHELTIWEIHIPAVCAVLESSNHVRITELKVESTSSRALEPLLDLVGGHLIKLEVYNPNLPMDLNMIGHHCPKLQYLGVNAQELISGEEFDVTETHFSEMKRGSLCRNYRPNPLPRALVALVCRVLASPTLCSFFFAGVPITEELVACLVAESGEQGALSSLERLIVCHPPSLDVGAMATLVSHAPRLDLIHLYSFGLEEEERFQQVLRVLNSFLQQSELETKCFLHSAHR